MTRSILGSVVIRRDQRMPLTFRADPLWFFGSCHALLWLACGYLFYQQGLGVFPADTRAHAFYAMGEVESSGSAYSLLHAVLRLMAWVGSLFGDGQGIDFYVASMTLVLVASIVMTSVILVGYFNRYSESRPWLAGFAPILLVVVSMVIIPGYRDGVYIGVGTPNPWHNPTYIFAKPFSLMLFLLVLQMRDLGRDDSMPWRILFAISGLAIFSMWAKPSFLLSFLPAVAIYFLWTFLRRRLPMRVLLATGIALLPAVLPLVAIEASVYGKSNEAADKVIFTFGSVWKLYTESIPVSILLGMAFPLYVAAVYRSRMSKMMALAILNFVFSALIYYFLAEAGFRFNHANFSWSYLFGMYFMFFAALETFLFGALRDARVRLVGWVILAAHTVSGLVYFNRLLLGGAYL